MPSASEVDGRLVLRFDVTDTGVGLSKAVQERLFLPFVEIDKRLAGEAGSTGLGLSIAKKLASLMGGEVGCESVVGQGTLYWFTLPAGRALMSAPAAKAEQGCDPARHALGPCSPGRGQCREPHADRLISR